MLSNEKNKNKNNNSNAHNLVLQRNLSDFPYLNLKFNLVNESKFLVDIDRFLLYFFIALFKKIQSVSDFHVKYNLCRLSSFRYESAFRSAYYSRRFSMLNIH